MAVAVAGITVLHPENPLSEIKSIISNYSIGFVKRKAGISMGRCGKVLISGLPSPHLVKTYKIEAAGLKLATAR